MIFCISPWSIWPSALAALIIALSTRRSLVRAGHGADLAVFDWRRSGADAPPAWREACARFSAPSARVPSTAMAPPRAAPPSPPPSSAPRGRADAADLRAGEAADLVLPQEVLGPVGEAAAAAGPAERALQLAEDAVEPALVHVLRGLLQASAGLGLPAEPLLHDLSENVAEAHEFSLP